LELKRQAIRILVADHQSLYRQGLLTLIEPEQDFAILGTTEDYVQLARELANRPVDVTIVAEDLPGLNGLAGLRDLRLAGTQLLVLTAAPPPERLDGPDAAGVAASITREEAPALLLPLIRQLASQSSTLSLQNLASTIDHLRSASSAPPAVPWGPALTSRENEILRLLAAGNTVKDAAIELDLSVKTIEAHKFNLMRKLKLHSRSELLSYARECGITTQPVPA
jgi:two-component system, NarL family, response regulator NreC